MTVGKDESHWTKRTKTMSRKNAAVTNGGWGWYAASLALAGGMMLATPAMAADEHHDHAQSVAQSDGKHAHGEDAHEEHADEVTLSSQAIKMFDIRVEAAKARALAHTVVAPGRIAFNAERMAHVGSAVSGRVGEIKVVLGDQVKKGDVLLVVDSPELGEAQSDYLMKRTTIATAQSAVDVARSAFERAQALYKESKGIALAEVQRREAEFKAAQGALLGAQATVTAAENRLHLLGMTQDAVAQLEKTGEIDPKYKVRAPLDGQVVEREATLGELVRPDREALLILADMTTVWVVADVAEAKLDDVAIGSRARIQLTSRKETPLEGAVSYISPALDPSTRTAKVRIEVKNGHGLRPGMFAQVRVSSASTNAEDQVLAVPDEAVATVEGAPAVFVPVEGEEGTFARRAVRVGPVTGGMVPILSGIEEGQRVVVSGTFILKAELGKGSASHEH